MPISDIFVVPFTTYNDPIRILVLNNTVDQIIARIFGLVCGLIGYQKVEYVTWTSQKVGGNIVDGIMYNLTYEGAVNEKERGNLNISISLGVRYSRERESHILYDHGKDLGDITEAGFYGLYRVTNENEVEQDLSYRTLQLNDQKTRTQLLDRLDLLSVEHYANTELCPDRTTCSTIIAKDRDDTQFIEDYIKTYHLRSQVFWLGENFKENLRTLIKDTSEEFFVLHWTPSDITHVVLGSNATLVKMPTCNKWDVSTPHLKCMFDPIPQIKFANKMLENVPVLDLYLKEQFTFTNEQYLNIIKEFEIQNKTKEDFACDWLSNHSEFYRKKINESESKEDFAITFAILSPKIRFVDNPLTKAADKAISLIKELKWLKKYTLDYITDTDHFNQVRALEATNRIIAAKAKVVIGPSRSSEIQIVAGK